VTVDPGTFLWAIVLPVNKVFDLGTPSSGVEDRLHPVDGLFFGDVGRRRYRIVTRSSRSTRSQSPEF